MILDYELLKDEYAKLEKRAAALESANEQLRRHAVTMEAQRDEAQALVETHEATIDFQRQRLSETETLLHTVCRERDEIEQARVDALPFEQVPAPTNPDAPADDTPESEKGINSNGDTFPEWMQMINDYLNHEYDTDLAHVGSNPFEWWCDGVTPGEVAYRLGLI